MAKTGRNEKFRQNVDNVENARITESVNCVKSVDNFSGSRGKASPPPRGSRCSRSICSTPLWPCVGRRRHNETKPAVLDPLCR